VRNAPRITKALSNRSIAYPNDSDATYSAYEDILSASGTKLAEAFDKENGFGSLTLFAYDLTVDSSATPENVSFENDAFPLARHGVETIIEGGSTGDGFTRSQVTSWRERPTIICSSRPKGPIPPRCREPFWRDNSFLGELIT
jgi:hypothetical protein